MKITKTKIKKELVKNYEWYDLEGDDRICNLIDKVISDTIEIIDDILMKQKGITITGKRK